MVKVKLTAIERDYRIFRGGKELIVECLKRGFKVCVSLWQHTKDVNYFWFEHNNRVLYVQESFGGGYYISNAYITTGSIKQGHGASLYDESIDLTEFLKCLDSSFPQNWVDFTKLIETIEELDKTYPNYSRHEVIL